MKIEISRDELLGALGIVGGVVERRQTLPILANVLVQAEDGQLELTTTDLELGITTRIGGAGGGDGGSVTVPARKLIDFCRSLREGASLTLRTERERCIVSSGRTRFTLATLPAADFPSMVSEAGMEAVHLPAKSLKRLLEKTAFAMAQQDVRYYLNGVLVEFGEGGLTAVATDGHRLARFVIDLEGGSPAMTRQLILPGKTVTELRRLLPDQEALVELRWSERVIVARFGATEVTSKLVDGKYPEYERVIPKGLPYRAVLDRDALRTALQRAAILSNEKYKGVRVTFGNGVLLLQAENPEHELAEDELESDYSGAVVTIGFNVAYLLDALQSMEGDQVEVGFEDADSSSIWRGLGCDSETFVVMPMRL